MKQLNIIQNAITPSEIRQVLRADGVNEQTIDRFLNWLHQNRACWLQFERFALDALTRNKKIGAKAVIERCRWETEIEHNDTYKCNNDYTAYLARTFNQKWKTQFFETRECRGLRDSNR